MPAFRHKHNIEQLERCSARAPTDLVPKEDEMRRVGVALNEETNMLISIQGFLTPARRQIRIRGKMTEKSKEKRL